MKSVAHCNKSLYNVITNDMRTSINTSLEHVLYVYITSYIQDTFIGKYIDFNKTCGVRISLKGIDKHIYHRNNDFSFDNTIDYNNFKIVGTYQETLCTFGSAQKLHSDTYVYYGGNNTEFICQNIKNFRYSRSKLFSLLKQYLYKTKEIEIAYYNIESNTIHTFFGELISILHSKAPHINIHIKHDYIMENNLIYHENK